MEADVLERGREECEEFAGFERLCQVLGVCGLSCMGFMPCRDDWTMFWWFNCIAGSGGRWRRGKEGGGERESRRERERERERESDTRLGTTN